jgi:hypothetical protein
MTRFSPLWLQAGTYAAGVDRRLPGVLWPAAACTGCAVSVASAMTLNVAPGSVAVPTPNNTGTTLCVSDAVEQVTLAAAPGAGSNRIDLVCCQARGTDLDGGANNDFVFVPVTGTAAASPVAPAVPPGAVALASILVPGASASITAGNITDLRPPLLGLAWDSAWGLVAPPAIITANSASAAGNVPGCAVTFPAVANRRYRITGQCRNISTAVSSSPELLLARGATVIGAILLAGVSMPAGNYPGGMLAVFDTPGAGVVTYNLSRGAVYTVIANTTGGVAFVAVEDVGPVTQTTRDLPHDLTDPALT